jgi:hypothetical protein
MGRSFSPRVSDCRTKVALSPFARSNWAVTSFPRTSSGTFVASVRESAGVLNTAPPS